MATLSIALWLGRNSNYPTLPSIAHRMVRYSKAYHATIVYFTSRLVEYSRVSKDNCKRYQKYAIYFSSCKSNYAYKYIHFSQ